MKRKNMQRRPAKAQPAAPQMTEAEANAALTAELAIPDALHRAIFALTRLHNPALSEQERLELMVTAFGAAMQDAREQPARWLDMVAASYFQASRSAPPELREGFRHIAAAAATFAKQIRTLPWGQATGAPPADDLPPIVALSS